MPMPGSLMWAVTSHSRCQPARLMYAGGGFRQMSTTIGTRSRRRGRTGREARLGFRRWAHRRGWPVRTWAPAAETETKAVQQEDGPGTSTGSPPVSGHHWVWVTPVRTVSSERHLSTWCGPLGRAPDRHQGDVACSSPLSSCSTSRPAELGGATVVFVTNVEPQG